MQNPFKLLFSKSKTAPADPSPGYFIIPTKEAGILVNEDTALKFGAVFSCIKIIIESISSMSWHVYQRRSDGGKDMLPDSSVDWMLSRQTNKETNAIAWREAVLKWALTWGNGYAEIAKDRGGKPSEMWQIKPDRVEVTRDNSNRLVYDINNGAGNSNTVLMPSQVFHLHGLGDDGYTGHSVISLAARSIGLGLGAEKFGSGLFANGAQPGGILTAPGKLSDPARERLKKAAKSKYTGDNAFSTMILEEGLTWTATQIPPHDAQFLESRKFQVTEIARWYRVPPHKVMDLERATFDNIEAQNIDFVVDCLLPWVKKLETEADIKLFPRTQRGRQFTKINMSGLLRGDSKARGEYYNKMWTMGSLNANEIREKEDMNPIGDDGEKYLVQLNLTTLEKAGTEPPKPAGQIPNETALQSHKTLLQNAITKIYKREDSRIKDGMTKYKNQDDFELFLANFFPQHTKYIKDTITPHIESINALFKSTVSAFDLVENYTQYHVEKSRNRALNGKKGNVVEESLDYLLEIMCLKVTV